METKGLIHVSAPDHPEAGVETFPWRGVRLLCGGGVQDPMRGPGPRGGPDSLGGPEPWLLALERPSKAWDTWRSQTFPGRGTGPDLCREDRTSDRRGPAVWL